MRTRKAASAAAEPAGAAPKEFKALASAALADLGAGGPAPDPRAALTLQRAVGNAVVQSVIAKARAKPRIPRDAKFRIPTPDELKQLDTGGIVPHAVVVESVERALKRMDADIFRLRTGSSDVMSKLFPGGGAFDASQWDTVLGHGTEYVYNNPADARAQVTPGDTTKLQAAAQDAMSLIDQVVVDEGGLKDVFGSKWKTAQSRYGKAKASMQKTMAKSTTHIDTDYNRDDPETGLGGWATYNDQHIHLTGDVAEVKDHDATVITLIHECAHLSNPAVDDLGYYGSPGYEAMKEDEKVNNAAHYEELPDRLLKRSRYYDPADPKRTTKTFTPGTLAGGKSVTFEDEVMRSASEYLRKAWDAANDVHEYVRGVAIQSQKSPAKAKGVFATNKKTLLEISQIEQLTIHRQQPGPTSVTSLDLALTEGVAHATVRIRRKADPGTITSTDKTVAANEVINAAIASYGELLGDPAADRALMDWLVAHYRKGFGP
jgi:hypothetical protein